MSSLLSIDSGSPSELFPEAGTLVELLRLRAALRPEGRAYTFLAEDGTGESTLTYGALERQARAIGARLQATVAPGDRVLLLYPPGLGYVAAFFGCLYAGAVAVPAYPPRNNRNLLRLQTLVGDARAAAALTTTAVLSRILPQLSQHDYLKPLAWLTSEEIDEGEAEGWQEPGVGGESLALLQYTSGSTSSPKGVMISHRNLLHNERMIREVFGQGEQSLVVGWLPMYHDMGLIGNVIQPLYVGAPAVLMSPTAFLQQPLRWLEAITRYRATTSGGPNFAYELCARRITDEQRETLDLSSWCVAFNGSEPVRGESLERFAEVFAPCGFRRDAFQPCYGLAEATLLVSGRSRSGPLVTRTFQVAALERGRGVASLNGEAVRTLVGCGGAAGGQEVVVVDPETLSRCEPGRVGEVWVSGPSVAQGYWGKPEETERTFQARLAGTGEGPFLRTGDLGFLLGGELFVTGRLKDLIIIRGLNHYPHDIELTVEQSHPSLRPGCGAAFSVEVGGEERLVVVQEVDHRRQFDAAAIIEGISEAVSGEHEVQSHAIVLVKPGSIPKTSSGKIQRYACREAFLRGTLNVLAARHGADTPTAEPAYAPAPPDPLDAEATALWLRALVGAKLGLDPRVIDTELPIARYGVDSLAAVELAHAVEAKLGVTVPLTLFLQDCSVAAIAARVRGLKQTVADVPGREAVTAVGGTSEQPLSAGQQALWFLHLVEPESTAYNIVGAVRVLSDLDAAALRRAFEGLVARHHSLRTTFGSREGVPVQRVAERAEADFVVEDATGWDEAAVGDYLSREGHRSFDLEAGPLLRVRLLRRSAREHVLLLSLHHIIADLWSLAVLMHELGVLYEAEQSGSPAALPRLARQYADYVGRQRELLGSEEGRRLHSYWEKQLAGDLPALNLPTDRVRPPAQTYRGAAHTFRLDASLTRALKEFGRARGATLYTTLLAAFEVLLHRYTDQEELLIGSPTSGRGSSDFAGVVGYFVNPVVIRADLSGDPTFDELLEQTRRTVLDAFEHQDYPFALLTERLQPARDASRSPIFQVMFAMRNVPLSNDEGLAPLAVGQAGARLRLGPLDAETLAVEYQSTLFDLSLTMAEFGGGLSASLQYSTDLFEADTMRRMAGHFKTLLEGVLADAGRRVRRLPLLSADESRRLLIEWNDTAGPYSREKCVHQLVEEAATQTPDALAVAEGDERLSFGELNRRANRLAHYLRTEGVGPEVRVGVLMGRCADFVVGVLGALKAGAAYVPLDPTYPQDRLLFMLEDAGVPVLLTQAALAAELPELPARVVRLDADWETIEGRPGHNPPALATTDNLAYMIYTSGSTGRPKGVQITHGSLLNLVFWHRRAYAVTAGDRAPLLARTGFDGSVWELWPYVTAGASVHIPREEIRTSPSELRDWFVEQAITIAFLPPLVVETVAPLEWPAGAALRTLLTGSDTVRRYPPSSLPFELVNNYGPTEYAVIATAGPVRAGAEGDTPPHIGRPIENTEIYILDRELQPVPAGVRGELCIGGVGLARGYLNRPALTAEKFIPHPFSTEPGARLYRSGDLARYLPDGNIDFLGRADHQVKLRGFRIELGEIEAALQQLPHVREAVVMLREDVPGERRLAAYLVTEPDRPLTVAEARAYLNEKLPSFMVPAAFVFLERLPATSNGKVDRRALPPPEQARPELGADFVGPRNATEQALTDIWAEVLRIEAVGVYDNFFELGGDSILSIQIVARANRAGLKLSPRQLFQYQNIAQLAVAIGTAQETRAEQSEVTGPAPLTPIQRWFFAQELPNPNHWNLPLLLELRQSLQAAPLEQAIRRLVLQHDALRLRFKRGAAGWEQSHGGVEESFTFSQVNLSHMAADAQAEALEKTAAECQAGLDISAGPLLHVVLFDLGPDKPGRLLLVLHHLIGDGVSWRILLEDLEAAYRQAGVDESVSLQPRTTSYKSWAEGLSEYARSAELEGEIPYWLAASSAGDAHLLVDFPGGDNSEGSARTVSTELDIDETRALLHEVPAAYRAQAHEALLSALVNAFSKLTGEASLLVDVEGHGREEMFAGADLSRTVGWFTSIYPVSLKSDAAGAAAALAGVKETLRRVPRGGVGYGLLRYVRGDEALASQPQAEVAFNYLGQLDGALDASALFAGLHDGGGAARDPRGRRRYLLELQGAVVGGRLRLSWTYSENLHARGTVERLAAELLAAVRAIIQECRAGVRCRLRPSDLPLAGLDERRLGRLLDAYEDLEDAYPLVPVQQGLLFHSQYAAEPGMYVTQVSCTLRGGLDEAAFERAWREVVGRHAILRTAFAWENLEEPLQVVTRGAELALTAGDWRGMSDGELDESLTSFLRADRERGFDLRKAPLMRLALFRTHDDAHRFVWCHHHLILDGWSLPLILREVFTLYESYRAGREARLGPVRPYLDYVEWLRRQDPGAGEAFWRKTLEGFSAPTPLMLDRAQGDSHEAADLCSERQASLSPAVTEALHDFARRHQLTLNTLLQGAWGLLLSRYSGAAEVVFGTAVSGRPGDLPGAEATVGIFINTLPVRVPVPADGSVSAWLRGLQEGQADLQRYEHTPLVQIQGWSEVPRGLPLFESVLVFLNYPRTEALLGPGGGLRVEDLRWLEQTNYPLTIQVTPGRELLVKATYDPRRFDAQTVERILGNFAAVLESLSAEPERRLSQLSPLTGEERRRVLEEWNDTHLDYDEHRCLHELFEEQAARTPGAVAVSFEGTEVSYAELNRRANQLARHLRALGVGPEVAVGVCVERSVEMVVALLAVLKAGAAYVPLDPDYPLERLSYMLEDAALGVLLTQERLSESLPSYWGHTLLLDADRETFEGEDAENLPAAATDDNLAYVIYTSGSTGKPKGAMLSHRGVVNCLRWMQDTYRLDASDRFMLKTSLNFDPSVWELFWTLWQGGRVVVARPGGHLDTAYLVETIVREQVTSIYFVPSMLRAFLEEPLLERANSLRRVICGGEGLPKETMRKFFKRLGSAELHHSYGPTEASIAATEWTCEPDYASAVVPLGRPLANTEIYLLDGGGRPVAVGTPGELYIGGVGVGRGYLNRPGLTAERFVPHPFSTEPGARLYRTGDRARHLTDGTVEFVGRMDEQLKVRGYRIEPGEIEATLSAHPAVSASLVLACEGEEGTKQLVAYVVLDAESSTSVEELRAHVRGRLPEYMVPDWIVPLEEMPLATNGKVDRRALPAPESASARAARDHSPARTPAEEVLSGIWREVLGLPALSVETSFFELGGHSLLATQVMIRIREAFGVEMHLRSLFESPTVRGLAAAVERELMEKHHVVAPPITRAERGDELPLSYAQQRLWFAEQLTPGTSLYNVSAALRLAGQLDADALERTLREVVRRHEVLRSTFPSAEGRPVQVVSPTADFALPVDDLSALAPAEREERAKALVREEAERPFDLSTGPLVRARLIKLSDSEHVAAFAMHHIVSDGWSMGLLVKEVAALYDAYPRGGESPLEELAIQYADYAVWQRQWLQGEVLERQLDYWRARLDGAPAVLELPTDRPRTDSQGFRGAHLPFSLSNELSEGLRALSRREGATLYMTLLAAWQALLYHYTGQPRVSVGSPVAGRARLETEALIGFFINTLVMHTELGGDPSFRELLGRVREGCLGAYAHQDVPFDKLVEELQPERSLSHTPLFQVWFTVLDSPLDQLRLDGLGVEEFAFERLTAKFDLALLVTDTGRELSAILEYNSDLFEAATVARMAAHLETLLRSAVADPDRRLGELSGILDAEDRKRRSEKAQEFKAADRQKLKGIKRKVISG